MSEHIKQYPTATKRMWREATNIVVEIEDYPLERVEEYFSDCAEHFIGSNSNATENVEAAFISSLAKWIYIERNEHVEVNDLYSDSTCSLCSLFKNRSGCPLHEPQTICCDAYSQFMRFPTSENAQIMVEYILDKHEEYEERKNTPIFECMECGEKFNDTESAEIAMDEGCPGCDGSDIDIYVRKEVIENATL